MLSRIRNLLRPPVVNDNEEDALSASLLHTILLILAVAGFVVPLVLNIIALQDPRDEIPFSFFTLLLGLFVPGLALWLLRLAHRGRVRLAGAIMTGTLFLLTTSTIASFRGTRDTATGMYILVIAMAGLLLGGQAALLFTLLSLLATLGIYYAEVNGILTIRLTETPEIVEWIIFAFVVLLISLLLRFAFETLNRALRQTREANEEMESMQVSLAERIEARTKDLKLAAEIGRKLSRMRESKEILLEAVELIGSSFDLYYTQIYLFDASRNNLVLRAGTGEVGRRLRRLGHRLPLSSNSINGTAVVNNEPVIVSDTAESTIFRQNPLLPETRSEMAVPLVVSGEVIGSLNLQSDQPDNFTEENLPAFEALAGQLAIAIDNARLFTETAETQEALESLAQRLTRSGWAAYLNAIDRKESISYTYDLSRNEFDDPPDKAADNPSFAVPIQLGQEVLGEIEVQGNEWHSWQQKHKELAAAVAQRVAQQIENLRLLSETERYRTEAEEATKRLTREGWESYIEGQMNQPDGYSYDRQEVSPLPGGNGDRKESDLVRDLTVRGETIGQFEIEGAQDLDEETAGMVDAVAERLSAHIENLRLATQTEIALAETEEQATRLALLTELGQALSQVETLQEVYEVTAARAYKIIDSDRASIALLAEDDEHYDILALGGEHGSTTVGERQPLEGSNVGVAIRENRLVVVNESEDSGISGIYAFMVAPLVASGRVIGTLNIGSKSTNAFGPQEEKLLLQMSSLLATTIESRRLLAQTQHRAEELSVVNQVAQAVSGQIEQKELLETVYEQVQRVMPVDAFAVTTFNPDSEMMHFLLVMDEGKQFEESPTPLGSGSLSRVIREGQPILINRTAEELEELAQIQDAVLIGNVQRFSASLVYVPLQIGTNTIGGLSIQSYELNAYGQPEVELLVGIANHVAVALENARLFEETEARARELAILNEMSQELTATQSVEGILNSFQSYVSRLMEATDACIALVDDAQDELVIREFEKGKANPVHSHLPKGSGLAGYVIQSKQPLLLSTNVEDQIAKLGIEPPDRMPKTWLGTPLSSGMKVIGMIAVQSFKTSGLYTERHRNLLMAVANQIATAIESARLFEEAQARTEELAILNEMGRSLTALVDVDAILDNVYRYTSRLMDTSNFYVSFYNMKLNEITFALDIRGERVMRNAGSRKAGKGLTEHIIHTKEPLLISENVNAKLDELGIEKIGPSAASWLGVPMMVGSQVVGVIGLQQWDTPRAYNEQHLRLLNSVAAQAAIAIENARLFEQIQARARRERILREVTAKVRGASDADSVMRTAVQEIGRALGRRTYVYLNPNEQQEMEPMKEETYGD